LDAAVGFIGDGGLDEAFIDELPYSSVQCPCHSIQAKAVGHIGLAMGSLRKKLENPRRSRLCA
jgi:hypothetical protein